MIKDQLFRGERVYLSAHDPDKDAATESAWTHDSEYMTSVSAEAARPLSAAQIKKKYEEAAKEKNPLRISFAIRLNENDRLIGFARLDNVEWANQAGSMSIGIGAATDRRKGFGTEALSLFLNYMFDEVNMHRLTAQMAENNKGAVRLFEKAGFQLEVRRREGRNRGGVRCDELTLGLLRREWESK